MNWSRIHFSRNSTIHPVVVGDLGSSRGRLLWYRFHSFTLALVPGFNEISMYFRVNKGGGTFFFGHLSHWTLRICLEAYCLEGSASIASASLQFSLWGQSFETRPRTFLTPVHIYQEFLMQVFWLVNHYQLVQPIKLTNWDVRFVTLDSISTVYFPLITAKALRCPHWSHVTCSMGKDASSNIVMNHEPCYSLIYVYIYIIWLYMCI